MWLATFIYEYPQHHLQYKLWSKISGLLTSDKIPWMIIRDLNELSSVQEKFANNFGNSTRFNKFNNVLNKNNL